MTSISPPLSSSVDPTEDIAGLTTDKIYRNLQPVTVASSSPRARFNNWGQSFYCTPLAVFEPETEEQCKLILELARREGKVVRAVGVGHSPGDLACTTGFMIRMTKFKKMLEISVEGQYFTAQAGITLNEVNQELARYSLAISNLGSISEQTLGGVITTATHGTGITFPVICKSVLALKVLLADGTIATCSPSEDSDLFNATLSGIGSTGIILTIKMKVEPAFRLKEYQESIPFDDFIRDMGRLLGSAEHVRFWWFPASGTVRCVYANRTTEPRKPGGSWVWDRLVGYHGVQLLFFLGRYVPRITVWTGYLAGWLESGKSIRVDDSYRVFNIDCRYLHYTTEWAVPLKSAEICMRELRTWLENELADPKGFRPHFPVEVRFTAKDDLWLSPSSTEETCWIGIVQYKPYGFPVPYRKYFSKFEEIVFSHGGKPHWAKMHKLKPEDLRRLYPGFDDYRRVLERVDPKGVFRSEYVIRHMFGVDVDSRIFKLRK